MKYIATREGVEKLSGNGPVTKGQRELIQKLLHDFPDAAELFEYEDYCKTPTLGTASAFITMALDANLHEMNSESGYMSYIATRPRVERHGAHGLFMMHTQDLARAMRIPVDHFRWYAAFHNEGHHPHIHMMVWSDNPKEGFLTREGIAAMRSKLTNTIFRDEMNQIYERKESPALRQPRHRGADAPAGAGSGNHHREKAVWLFEKATESVGGHHRG